MDSLNAIQDALISRTYRVQEGFRDRLALVDSVTGVSAVVNESSDAVLMYHSVSDSAGEIFGNVGTERFERDIARFSEEFSIVDLPQIISGGSDDDRQLAITFDDGYKNFYENAAPVLRNYGIPATVFISSQIIGEADRKLVRKAHSIDVSRRMFLNEDEILELIEDELVTIGNHTRTHRHLPQCSITEKRDEILGAKRELEENFDIDIDRFCYPYGEIDPESVEIVRSSHELATGSHESTYRGEGDRCELPRVHAHKAETRVQWELTELSDRLSVSRWLGF